MPVTAIVILFLLPFSGAISAQETYAYFGNRAVFFILGAFILASPIMRSGMVCFVVEYREVIGNSFQNVSRCKDK
ncbi:hypothetical protein NG799_25340 [Laspinema sp. D1]|uniref:Uncharacterized protein n=1 Tax=Laspinema palackyanum D2a TaxID=2953684 RepID=A0ABT2MY18_9CYAN|nr:hypothetical protein [Laspinema sp. D2a]